jgi:two-component system, NarL family, response regulator LiaR
MQKTITIVIVEDLVDHQFFLNTIISSVPEFKSIHLPFSCCEDALEKIPSLKPDIVLMDIGLPGLSGIDCIKKLKFLCPEIKFMICTVHNEDENVFEALKAGADSYILKNSKPYQIIDAIRELYIGNAPISSDIARKILNHLSLSQTTNQHKSNLQYHITPKEAEVLNFLSQGHTYQEVADKLYISVKTLKRHVYTIYLKLHVDNKTEAINKYFGP